MNPTAIFSKTGKGVQEASGKTSNLSRADRAVLKEIDGKTALASIAAKFEKIPADKFEALITQFDKDGYIREVSSGATAPQAPPPRSAPPAKAPPPAGGGDDDMDFTQAIKLPPKAPPAAPKSPPVDLAAASRADAERKAKEQQAFDYKTRQEAELRAKAEAEAKAKAEARARAAEAEANAKALAEADAKVRAAREAAVRMATEAKARAEAEAKVKSDAAAGREREALERARKEAEEKDRLQAELTGKLEEERKAREEAERRASEAAERARKELEEKAKRDAEELRQRLEAEMKAKLEEERKAREAEDRKRREEEDRKRREEDERRRKEADERRAKEEAERRAREEEDRKRREEEDRRRKEEEARRAKDEADRRAREEAEREAQRKRREEDDRKRAEEDRKRAEEDRKRREEGERRRKEEDERRAKEDANRKAKEEAERKANEEADRRAREDADRRAEEEAERRARDEADRKTREEADARASAAKAASASSPVPSIPAAAPPPPPAGADIGDSLLADLDSFGQREEEEQRAKEEAERKAKEEAARKAKAEAERKAKEEAEKKRREEEERQRKEDEARRAREEDERQAREEEERQKQEEAERKRIAKEAQAAKETGRRSAQRATAAKSAGKGDDDIEVSDDDLDMDEIKKDQKALSATARKEARERETVVVAAPPGRRPMKWGKPAAIALFVLLAAGIGVLQLMPVSTAEYEKAASEAMGVPVKIGSARLSVITGIEARFENVSIGDMAKIRLVRGYPEVGSLFGGKKSFSRMELEGVSISQSQLGDAVLGKIGGENFRVGRILVRQVKFDGPLALPALDVEARVAGDGSLDSVSLHGGDKLSVQLSPRGENISFEISAGNLALPFAPKLNLAEFGMKGTATRAGVTLSEFDGRAFDGVISGTAKIRWGANWTTDGEVRARGVKVAVLAPALVSEGTVEARGAYSMSGPNPATLFESARIQGDFKIDKGVLGSFDLTRALQTGGAQTGGRTVFSEMTGQAVYDRGTVKVSNVAIVAGAMNAGAALDIDANGGLAGRVVADVKMPNQTLRAALNVSGKIQDPVIRK